MKETKELIFAIDTKSADTKDRLFKLTVMEISMSATSQPIGCHS